MLEEGGADLTDADRIAQQERDTLAVIESGSVRRNTPGIPKEDEAPPEVTNETLFGPIETQASAKFRHEMRASGMTAQEAENMVAEMEGRPPREMPVPTAGLVSPVAIEVARGYEPLPGPRVEPVEMTDDEWAAARHRVTEAKANLAAAKADLAMTQARLEAAEFELEAARRDVAAGAAWLTAP